MTTFTHFWSIWRRDVHREIVEILLTPPTKIKEEFERIWGHWGIFLYLWVLRTDRTCSNTSLRLALEGGVWDLIITRVCLGRSRVGRRCHAIIMWSEFHKCIWYEADATLLHTYSVRLSSVARRFESLLGLLLILQRIGEWEISLSSGESLGTRLLSDLMLSIQRDHTN